MHDVKAPEIEDPERFFPDPVLLKAPQTRILDDGYGEFYHPHLDTWERIHPICLDIIAGLQKGLTFEGIVAQTHDYPAQNINKQSAARLARKYIWKLHKLGYVHLALEEPPAVFHGRYERVKELGRGGLGVAHLCRDLQDGGREVVVKHPWGVKSKIESGQRAVLMEIRLLETLQGPAFPRLYDQFQVRGLLHMVRDYIDGRRLSWYAREGGVQDRMFRLDLARQCAEILHAVHGTGHVFFDPSPDNFFVIDDRRVVVTDIGGCAPMDPDGRVPVKGPRGTAGYVAPEMRTASRHGKYATRASDIYSFGALYYYLTLGRRPSRTSREAEIRAELDRTGVPAEDRAIIEACCQDDHTARPQDMRLVMDLLR